MTLQLRIGAALLVMFCGLVCVPSAEADLWKWDPIFLDGLQVPVSTPGTGTATAMLDTDTGIMTIEGTFMDLIGTTTNAHLHGPADPGMNAGIFFGLTFDAGATSGSFSGTSGVLSSTVIGEILNGRSYINVHTSVFPGGEIRGQLVDGMIVPEPAALVMLLASAGFTGLRER